VSNITFTPPTPQTPGFLRRAREAIRFSELLKEAPTVATIDALATFLLQFVSNPEDRSEAMDALLDASQEQFQELLTSLTGGGAENPL
jgi:hypothetical protein